MASQGNGLFQIAGLGHSFTPGMTQVLTADVSGIVTTTPGIVVFQWGPLPTLPAVAMNYGFECDILYQQATAVGGVGFAIQGANNAPARIDAWAEIYTNTTGTCVASAIANLATTTATAFSTATPSATATTFHARIWGLVQSGAAPTTLNILAFTGAGADAVTIKAGSKAVINW